jgi:membrane-bound lytic murein transglycosylase B
MASTAHDWALPRNHSTEKRNLLKPALFEIICRRRQRVQRAVNQIAASIAFEINGKLQIGRSNQPWMEGLPNFRVLQKWNESEVYAKTVAYFAMRLEKEP